jgi:hypothetical protein
MSEDQTPTSLAAGDVRIEAQPMVPLDPQSAATLFLSGSILCYVAAPASPFVCGQWMGRLSMVTELPFTDAVAYFTTNVAMLYDPNVPPPPFNIAPPTISGNPTVAWRLTCDPGAWSGEPTLGYQWLSNGAPIAGATGANHVCMDPDAGASLSCQVAARNAQGDASAISNAMTIAQGPPVNFTPPLCALNPTYLLCTGGLWTGGASVYNYQWYANGVAIGGATNSTWLFAGYEGQTGLCEVIVKNQYGACSPVNSNSVLIPAA